MKAEIYFTDSLIRINPLSTENLTPESLYNKMIEYLKSFNYRTFEVDEITINIVIKGNNSIKYQRTFYGSLKSVLSESISHLNAEFGKTNLDYEFSEMYSKDSLNCKQAHNISNESDKLLNDKIDKISNQIDLLMQILLNKKWLQ